jgi:conjugative relaxase-like TrwC/TraI family protein
MMSIRSLGNLGSGGSTAKLAATYYEEHSADYYLKDVDHSGTWLGLGAQRLGLDGQVDSQDFQLGLAGYVAGREVQNAGKENRQIGWDVTFSAPKSVSIAWANASPDHKREIEEDMKQSVQSAFNYLESHTTTRRGHGGSIHEEVHLVAAQFNHFTSRKGDPQLHAHVVISNFGVRGDGSVGTIESRPFYELKMAAGALFQVDFAFRMQKRGHEIGVGEKGTFRLQQVSKEAERLYSKRDQEIDRISQERGIRSYAGTRGVVLSTRPNKEITNLSERGQFWTNEAKKAGIDIKIERKSRMIVSEKSDGEILSEASGKLIVQESTFAEKELVREVAVASFGKRSGEEVLALTKTAEQKGHVVSLDRGVLTTPGMLKIEQGIISRVGRMLENDRYGVDPAKSIRQGIETKEGRKPFSEEQEIAIRAVTGASGIAVIQGRAGVGKSTMLGAVRKSYEDSGWKVQGIAYTGQAARNLQNESGIESKTIASWLPQKNVDNRTVVILDEAGTVGSKQMADVMEKVEHSGGKLILVGDERQLQPIAAGGILHAVDQKIAQVAPEFGTVVQDIKRQNEDWMKEVVKMSAQGQISDALDVMDKHGKLNIYQSPMEARHAVVNEYIEKNRNDFSKGIVLTNQRYDAQKINEEIRGKLQEKGLVKKDGLEFENDKGNIILSQGDRVIFTRNDYDLDVRNGQRGSVNHIDVSKGALDISLDNGEHKKVSVKEYSHLDYGWASTTHKAQGATVERAQVYGFSGETMTSKQATYVQISRAREETKLYIVAGERSVERELTPSRIGREERKEIIDDIKQNRPR